MASRSQFTGINLQRPYTCLSLRQNSVPVSPPNGLGGELLNREPLNRYYSSLSIRYTISKTGSDDMARICNFNAGPAAMPLSVLERAQSELLDLGGSGMSVMEMSHRSKEFQAIIDAAEAGIRRLMGVSEEYAVLFLQGGASLQFAMLPMNLRRPGKSADYVDTGSWASKAIKEAKITGAMNTAWSGKAENYTRIPKANELKLSARCRVSPHLHK